MKVNFKPSLIFLAILLAGCQSTEPQNLAVNKSYLSESDRTATTTKNQNETDFLESSAAQKSSSASELAMSYLSSPNWESSKSSSTKNLEALFDAKETIKISVDNLAVKDFIHYVFGDLLNTSYIVGDKASEDSQTLTLNIQEAVSKQKLFSLSEELLNQKGYVIRYNEGIFYIHQSEQGGKATVAFGYGFKPEDVPNTTQDIVQYVPFKYGNQFALVGTLNELFNLTAMPANQSNAIAIKGKRLEIVKALDFISMLDRPSLVNKHIAFYKPIFNSVTELSLELENLLNEEGITFSTQGKTGVAVSAVLLERSGAMVLFANELSGLKRSEYWLAKLDQPSQGTARKYHVYQPQFARATDLGQSLQVLIGGASLGQTVSSSVSAQSANNEAKQERPTGSLSASNQDMRMVVDERSNSLIIESSGEKYRDLLPLIKRLDVMPKQVMLEVIIAEVQLTGKFEQGVEFTLTNSAPLVDKGFGTLTGAAGTLNYILRGADGNVTLRFLETNSNLDVLSRPTIVVRDGVAANITAGDDIPTLGKIVTDPVNGSQSSVEYRKTGVQLTVTPTINAQGVVLMEIAQSISNTGEGSSAVEGAPIFADRTITTEVVAASGQTVVLGGLIRENNNRGESNVPFFSSLPILGKLFESKNNSKTKVELIVMVTPKIIENEESWEAVKKQFMSRFQYLDIEE
ncbi:hypothetical protein PALB_11780 [Pseudoalteromonas luteoviolacea B = ATCC 29581]|nr:hypothetical protein PALB_11780 [Pseudoalteromonas luteoviolacea B = ATCC 29581]